MNGASDKAEWLDATPFTRFYVLLYRNSNFLLGNIVNDIIYAPLQA